jgi:hypothetical protein
MTQPPSTEGDLATCLERSAAIDGLERPVAEVIADMGKTGEQIPEPFAERKFSGRFNVRIGEHLHRDLAMHAAEERMRPKPVRRQEASRRLTKASAYSHRAPRDVR